MIDNKTLANRLQNYLNFKKIDIWEFERILDVTKGIFYNAIKKNKTVGSDKLEIIINKFPELSAKWLLTGEGNMLLEENESNVYPINESNENTIVEDLKGQYVALVKNKIPDRLETFVLPYVVGYSQEEKEIYYESHKLPSHLGQNARGFVVHGISMFPLLNNDDIIFCKRVLDFSIHRFFEDDIYVIVLEGGIMVKHVRYAKGSEFVVLISANTEYPNITVPAFEVLEVWRAEHRMFKL